MVTNLAAESEKERVKQEIRRSNVRINITYILTWAYVLGVGGVMAYTIFISTPSDLTLGLLAGLSSASLGVIGFWFGGRKLESETKQIFANLTRSPTLSATSSLSQKQIIEAKTKLASQMPAGPPPRRTNQ